ncbi:hypothetical protein [Nodularia spumigena]|uniref:hypothetical protein n=1 Tax=Nodularia spumigena TaxID=70799 RepID=UPI0012903607|nr:hypothetical protein [Nodularia spumigena]
MPNINRSFREGKYFYSGWLLHVVIATAPAQDEVTTSTTKTKPTIPRPANLLTSSSMNGKLR